MYPENHDLKKKKNTTENIGQVLEQTHRHAQETLQEKAAKRHRSFLTGMALVASPGEGEGCLLLRAVPAVAGRHPAHLSSLKSELRKDTEM